MDEPVAPEIAAPAADVPVRPRRRRARRVLGWAGGVVAALALLIVAAVVVLNSPLGERFIASRIAARTFPNGLNITIGRIEGDLYGAAVLHDVRLSDPKGVFLTIPRAEIDWRPLAWLDNRLEIRTLTARRAVLTRVPAFRPSAVDSPILPGFDITVGRFAIDALTLAPGVAGARAQRVDATGSAHVADRRLTVTTRARLGERDALVLDLDARPDDDRFALRADLAAARGGPIGALAGLPRAYRARVRGQGSWTAWRGALVARGEDARVAALTIANARGLFTVKGLVDPRDFVSGTLARALGPAAAVIAEARIADRAVAGKAEIVGAGARGQARGKIDLAANRLDAVRAELALTDPALFGPTLRLEGARLSARIDGPLKALRIDHRAEVARLASGTFAIAGLTQRGTARLADGRLTLPLALTAARVTSGNAWLDPRLVAGRAEGTLTLAGDTLAADRLRVAFKGLAADLALSGNLASGRYRLAGPVRASELELADLGVLSGTAMAALDIGKGAPWRVSAKLDARLAPVRNATLANLAGPAIALRGTVAAGGGAPIRFTRLSADAAKLRLVLDGQIRAGATTLAGSGRHADYGAFTVEGALVGGKPRAVLVFAKPASWLDTVRLALAPRGDGFAVAASGGSVLGPFAGDLGVTAPRGGPLNIAIERLTVSDTAVSGALAIANGAAQGTLALAGGGVEGTAVLAPRDGGQGFTLALAAREARFGGATPLTIARGDLSGSGLLRAGHSTFTATAQAQGLSYGSLFVGTLGARGTLDDGRGRIDASLTGRRGSRFDLDMNALVAPERLALAARGNYAGRTIETPRRAVLTRRADGGWTLAQSQLRFGEGNLLAAGQFGGGETALSLQLARMPLSLLDLVNADLGLGGSISGLVTYRQARFGLPTGSARVKVAGLTRSGLLLSAKPTDLALVATLAADRLDAAARVENADIRHGRLTARIAGLPAAGALGERLRAGRLDGQLSYDGAAESLWRLAAINAFDITGPVAVSAAATGTLAQPSVRGAVSSDHLRLTSTLAGIDIREAALRGRFDGSRLQILRFAGRADKGTVTGSGSVDLAGLGERVQGRFLEVRGPKLDLKIAAAGARLLDAAGIGATVSGPLRIVSDGLGGTIAGRLVVDKAQWRLGRAAASDKLPRIATREVNLPADRGAATVGARPWRYLIDARASDDIAVDGMGLDSEWSADIRLRGTTADPRVGGRARMVRGDYSFAGSSFELTRGEIAFDENVAIDPRLDIRAESTVPGLTVQVRVTGSASAPEIAFTSTPALPEEEILARLLFGGSITSLSATDALQLGAALASLRGGGGLDPINRLRSAIGLDRLRIVSADSALGRGTGIALGKNITRRLYVELITDGKGYSATDLEFRITSWLSLLASVSTVGRESVVAEISRDY